MGAPPEVMARLTSVGHDFETRWRSAMSGQDAAATRDPELDQFMVIKLTLLLHPSISLLGLHYFLFYLQFSIWGLFFFSFACFFLLQEAYCDMLVKYREELMRPLQEAMDFMKRVESQLMMLTTGSGNPHISS